jgi:hypothetical protein
MLTGWFHGVLDSVSASKLGVHSPPGSSELTNRRHRFGVKRLGEDPATVGARLGVHDVRGGIRWISGALGHRLIGRDRDQDLPWTRVPGRLRRTSRVRRWWSLWFALRGVSASVV